MRNLSLDPSRLSHTRASERCRTLNPTPTQDMIEHTMNHQEADGMLHADPKWEATAQAKTKKGGCSVL